MGVDEMADGKAGYTEADFVGNNVAVSNFKKVRSATFDKTNPNYDDGSHLRKLTEKHIYRTGEIMHGVGEKLYVAPNNNNNNNNNNNLGKSYIDSAKSYVSYEDQDKKVNQAKAGQTLYDWQGFKYTTTDGGKTYTDPSGLNEPTADVLSGTRFGLSNRLSGITFGGGDGGGGATVADNTKKKYGWGMGGQSVKPSSILSSLKSFGDIVAQHEDKVAEITNKVIKESGYSKGSPTTIKNINKAIESYQKNNPEYHKLGDVSYGNTTGKMGIQTTGDLQSLLSKVKSDGNLKQKLIDHLNKEMGSNISTEFLDDMIKDLIGNTKKKLK